MRNGQALIEGLQSQIEHAYFAIDFGQIGSHLNEFNDESGHI